MKDETLPVIPPSDPSQSADAIAAEIADHLATTEAELTKRGATTEEAQAAARKKFGDVEKIQKTCYWIQNGETIMLRWSLVTLAAILCILLGLSVLGNWRTQSQLADEMGKLSAELKALAAAKQTPPPSPQPPAIPEISGVIYAGSKQKPVANAGITIIRTDGTTVRQVTGDENGKYRSGPLEAGDYCITTETLNPPRSFSPTAHGVTQSQPVFIYAGSGNVPLDMDTSFHPGKLKVSASRTLPQADRPGKYFLRSRLNVHVKMSRVRQHLWTISDRESISVWPVYSPDNQSRRIRERATALLGLKQSEEVPFPSSENPEVLAAGPTQIAATLMLNVFPSNGNEKIPAKDPALSSPTESRSAVPDGSGWWDSSMGFPWLLKLAGDKLLLSDQVPKHNVDDMLFQTIDIKESGFTRIRAEIPEGIEQEIEMAVEKTKDVEELSGLLKKGLLTRPVKLSVIGHEATE